MTTPPTGLWAYGPLHNAQVAYPVCYTEDTGEKQLRQNRTVSTRSRHTVLDGELLQQCGRRPRGEKTVTDRYINTDPRHVPTYSVAEVAHYRFVSATTLRSWVAGRKYKITAGSRYFEPLITLPDKEHRLLSFTNLVEAHVLAAIRRKHGVTIQNTRSAIDHLQSNYGVEHPLADVRFKTDGLNLFIDHLGQLVNVTMRGQLAMREVLEAHLKRVEHDKKGLAARLYPFTRVGSTDLTQPLTVVIDPRIAFGRPVLVGTGIPTAILADRYKAGESMQELAEDYECKRDMIEEAIRCELAAA